MKNVVRVAYLKLSNMYARGKQDKGGTQFEHLV